MDNNILRQALMKDLDTLKRNLKAVPREVLRTKYRKPYTKLCQDISANATAYVRVLLCQTSASVWTSRKRLHP